MQGKKQLYIYKKSPNVEKKSPNVDKKREKKAMTTARRPTSRPPAGGSKETTEAAANDPQPEGLQPPAESEESQTTMKGERKQP